MSHRKFTFLFTIIALLQLSSNFLRDYFPWFHYLSKPAIMISLGLFFYAHISSKWNRFTAFMLIAIIASLFGDIFLMLAGDYFIWGLGSFLLAHIFYLLVFTAYGLSPISQESLLKRKPWLVLIFLVYAVLLIGILYPYLGKMLIAVCIYALVIMSMSLAALNRWKRVSQKSFAFVFMGALLFMLSDSMIAINKFAFDIPLSHLWIMTTYITAQYLIVMGILRQMLSVKFSSL